jgi:hypothetical protein
MAHRSETSGRREPEERCGRHTCMRVRGFGVMLALAFGLVACGGQRPAALHTSAPHTDPAQVVSRPESGVGHARTVVRTIHDQRPAPRAVVRATRQLALNGMAAHPPVRAIWVRSTWAGWSRIDGEPLAASGERPTTAIYIIELIARRPMTCRGCKTLSPVRGRYAYAAFQVHGRGNDDLDVGNHRPVLAALGKVRVVFTAI